MTIVKNRVLKKRPCHITRQGFFMLMNFDEEDATKT
ncbi:hypothetical protein DFP82_10560 [Psychrobacter fozii]|uniref:Uncharacterized protein n=1 Tax=Psychrobacter fozii TaxID=198480 RepID=A0A2V4UQT9_9GAMM|nr:hypothetical protein DFP82_10560 [Psychrobacter fozii]